MIIMILLLIITTTRETFSQEMGYLTPRPTWYYGVYRVTNGDNGAQKLDWKSLTILWVYNFNSCHFWEFQNSHHWVQKKDLEGL